MSAFIRKSSIVEEIINDIEKNDELLSKWRKHYELEEEIIAKMVEIRRSKNVSQKELAKKCALKQSAIARIEKRVNSQQLGIIKYFQDEGLKTDRAKINVCQDILMLKLNASSY